MKITDFLKKFTLINSKFIDDFYSFYDEGKNEYDKTINLENITKWLNVRKDHLKKLLIDNFEDGKDYNEIKEKYDGKRVLTNNKKTVLLTYECAKLLCMISRSEKATMIRNFYIEIEKILINYKDNIAQNLYDQLEIKMNNKKIINDNNKKALIYILKVDDKTNEGFKIGKTADLKARMRQYNVGRISELPIVFVYQTEYIDEIENCMKENLKRYQLKHNTETFDIDLDFIKDTVTYCTKKNALLIKKNNKLFRAKDNKRWLIFIDTENIDIDELFKIRKIGNKLVKEASKKTSKKTSNKVVKKTSKKTSKKLSKKVVKKTSKKTSKKLSKKVVKKTSDKIK
jgi:phage anti-repressor protein